MEALGAAAEMMLSKEDPVGVAEVQLGQPGAPQASRGAQVGPTPALGSGALSAGGVTVSTGMMPDAQGLRWQAAHRSATGRRLHTGGGSVALAKGDLSPVKVVHRNLLSSARQAIAEAQRLAAGGDPEEGATDQLQVATGTQRQRKRQQRHSEEKAALQDHRQLQELHEQQHSLSRLQHGGRSADWQHMVSTNSSFPLIQPVDARPATAPLQAQAQAASVPQFPSPILSQRGELQQLPQTMSFSMQDGTFLNTGSFQQPTQQQTDLPASAHAALQQLDPVQQRDFATLLQNHLFNGATLDPSIAALVASACGVPSTSQPAVAHPFPGNFNGNGGPSTLPAGLPSRAGPSTATLSAGAPSRFGPITLTASNFSDSAAVSFPSLRPAPDTKDAPAAAAGGFPGLGGSALPGLPGKSSFAERSQLRSPFAASPERQPLDLSANVFASAAAAPFPGANAFSSGPSNLSGTLRANNSAMPPSSNSGPASTSARATPGGVISSVGGCGGGDTAWDMGRARSLSAPQLGQLDALAQALQAAQGKAAPDLLACPGWAPNVSAKLHRPIPIRPTSPTDHLSANHARRGLTPSNSSLTPAAAAAAVAAAAGREGGAPPWLLQQLLEAHRGSASVGAAGPGSAGAAASGETPGSRPAPPVVQAVPAGEASPPPPQQRGGGRSSGLDGARRRTQSPDEDFVPGGRRGTKGCGGGSEGVSGVGTRAARTTQGTDDGALFNQGRVGLPFWLCPGCRVVKPASAFPRSGHNAARMLPQCADCGGNSRRSRRTSSATPPSPPRATKRKSTQESIPHPGLLDMHEQHRSSLSSEVSSMTSAELAGGEEEAAGRGDGSPHWGAKRRRCGATSTSFAVATAAAASDAAVSITATAASQASTPFKFNGQMPLKIEGQPPVGSALLTQWLAASAAGSAAVGITAGHR